MIVLDTNVISELMKPQPDAAVLQWANAQAEFALFTTSLTIAEVLYGIESLPAGRRRETLTVAADTVLKHFGERMLPFDAEAAAEFARIVVARRRLGRPMSVFDAQIAAVAVSRAATIATRDTGDFQGCGVPLVNPWES